MDYIIGLIAFIFVLGVIIVIHELGHFIFARRVNILCREFAFGMGPLLYKKKKGETLYSIRALPIGGFCAIAGEELEDDPLKASREVRLDIEKGVIKKIYIDSKTKVFDDKPNYRLIRYDLFDINQTGNLYMVLEVDGVEKEFRVDPQAMYVFAKQEIQIAPYNRTLGSKRKRDRAMVMFGGPLMNFLLAFVVFFLAGILGGFPNTKTNQLADVSEGTPAQAYLLQKGDKILRLESGLLDQDVDVWGDVTKFMSEYSTTFPGQKVLVTLERDGKTKTISVTPQYSIYSLSLYSDYEKDGVFIKAANGKAKDAGLQSGDEITYVKIAGEFVEVKHWHQLYQLFLENTTAQPVELKIKRGSTELSKTVTPFSKEVMDSQQSLSGSEIPMVKISLGISPKNKFDLVQSFVYSGKMTASSFTLVFDTLGLLFGSDEVGVDDLSGPVGIFTMAKDVATQAGLIGLLNLIGLLSVNVGLLNLFPIPALDGGRLVFLGYEAITKKKPNQKVETALITVTMLLLFGLMIFVFYNDILRIIGVK